MSISKALDGVAFKIALKMGLSKVRDAAEGKLGPEWQARYVWLAGKKRWTGLLMGLIAVVAEYFHQTALAATLGTIATIAFSAGVVDEAWRSEVPDTLTQSGFYRYLAAHSSTLTLMLAGAAGAAQACTPLAHEFATWVHTNCHTLAVVVAVVSLVAAHIGLIDRASKAAPPDMLLADPPVRPRFPPAAAASLIFLLLAPVQQLEAQEAAPSPAPSPTAVASDEPQMRVHVDGIVLLTMAAGTAKPTPGLAITAEGPLVFGNGPHQPKVHGALKLDVLGVPGDTAAPEATAPTTWNTVRADGAVYVDVGSMQAAGQDLHTSVGGHAFFGTKVTADPEPLDRTIRGWALGIQFEERKSGLYFSAGVGHDDSVSQEYGHGHLLLSTQIPIQHTNGVASIGGEAALAIGRPEGVRTHDRVTIRLILELPTRSSSTASDKRAGLEALAAPHLALTSPAAEHPAAGYGARQ